MSKLAEVEHVTRLAVPAGRIDVVKKVDVAPEGELIVPIEARGVNTNPDCYAQDMWWKYRAVGLKTGTVYSEGETTPYWVECGYDFPGAVGAFKMPAEDVKSTLELWGKIASSLGGGIKRLAVVSTVTSPTPKPVPVPKVLFIAAPAGLGALLSWLSR